MRQDKSGISNANKFFRAVIYLPQDQTNLMKRKNKKQNMKRKSEDIG